MLNRAPIWSISVTIALLAMIPVESKAASIDHSAYVEANRPVMAKRKLSSAEAKAMQQALTAVQKTPSEASLLALKPYAESGDPLAIRAMMTGYNELVIKATGENPKNVKALRSTNPVYARTIPTTKSRLEDRYTPLAGLWAMVLAREQLPIDGEAGETLKQCMASTHSGEYDYWRTELPFTGKRKNFDCGFETYTSFGNYVVTGQKMKFAKGAPSPFRFVERPVTPQADLDRLRWDRTMHWLGGPATAEKIIYKDLIGPLDFDWARQMAYANPDLYPQWIAMQFNNDLKKARANRTELAPGTDVWLYMKADPAREQAYQNHLAEFYGDQWARNDRLQDAMAGKTSMSRSEMARIAMNAGGEVAEKYFRQYGADPSIGAYAFTFCNVGAQAACEQAKAEAATAAQPVAYSGGLYSQADLDAQFQAFKAREAAINQGNCARASLGASIICNR